VERLFAAIISTGGRLGIEETVPLSSTQRLALSTLVDQGAMRLGALAAAMGTTDATATRTVQALERLDLVEREPDESDGRGVRIGASPEGRELIARGRKRMALILEELVAEDERERVIELLRALSGAVVR
jgi:MarR family transcriptional regulator, 2-MHQ and catechol-resistance regulon repressor